MNTKISEAEVSIACDAWLNESAKMRGGDHDCMRAALEAFLHQRHPQPAELAEPVVTMGDAIAAGDGTLHGAIEHWQDRALAAEANLSQVSGDSGELGDGEVRSAIEDVLSYASHHESCGDSDSYNNADIPSCGCGFDAAVERLEEALAATGKQQVGVPDGWKLVPVEPTWDMRNEGREFLIEGMEHQPERAAYFLWKTMVASAPEVE